MAGSGMISTVTVAASSRDLVDLASVKSELNITGRGSDDQLRRYISQASAAAINFCNRVFVVETLQDSFWPIRDPWPSIIPGGVAPLQLSRFPLVSVLSVTENGTPLVVDVDYKVDGTNGQLLRLDGNAYPRNWPAFAIVVAFSAGFPVVPADVQDAVIRMVRNRWFAKDRDPMARSINIPGVLEQQFWVPTGPDSGAMTPDVVDLLLNFHVPVAVPA